MSTRNSAKSWSKLFQAISLLGLGLVPLMVLRAMMAPSVIESESQIVGFSFIAICIFGAIAGIRPSVCLISSALSWKQHDQNVKQESRFPEKEAIRRGHHYTCGEFSTHVLKIGERVFCAGCTGLATGAAIAIIGSFFYFILGVPLVIAELVFWMGFAGVAVGIVQHNIYRLLRNESGFFRFMVNIVFVNGAFLLLVAADELASSIAVNSYILLIVLFWINTRIAMSKSEHQRICTQCGGKLCINS
ncbi:MAG: hypothetical protein ACFFEA_11655 [Candidatus Thorarchaeota archaeon]